MKSTKINTYALFLCFGFEYLLPAGSVKAQQKSLENNEIIFSNLALKKVIEIAKASHKKIFVDPYATWYAPCKQLPKQHSTMRKPPRISIRISSM